MTVRHGDAGADRPRTVLVVLGGVLAFGCLLGVWIALAGQPDDQDLVAGSGSAAVAVAVGFFVSQRGRALPSIRLADLKLLVALPKKVVVETGQVFVAVVRKAAGKGEQTGSWGTIPLSPPTGHEISSTGWPAARRDSVLTVLLSAAPNTIVADIDAAAGTALIHSLVDEPDSATIPVDGPGH